MEIPNVEFQPPTKNSIGIEVIELDQLYARSFKDHDPSMPHRVEFHCLIYIEKGSGSHFIDFNKYPIGEGSLIFVNKHQLNAFDFKNQPKGKLILFTEDFIEGVRTNIRTPLFAPTHLTTSYMPVFTLSDSVKISCEALLQEINREQNNPNCEKQIIQLLFMSLLLILTRERPSVYSNHLSESRVKKFLQFMSLIEESFISTRDASIYANMMHMTYKSLNQICKLASNQTAKQLIDAHTVLEAKRKLVVESIQVQTLAYELGFDEVTNFIKYFKKHTLLTPSQFKASLKG